MMKQIASSQVSLTVYSDGAMAPQLVLQYIIKQISPVSLTVYSEIITSQITVLQRHY